MLSCCLPFSAALADDFDDMKNALDANLQALRQIRANIQNTKEIPWAMRKRLMEGAQWEIDRAVERQAAFNAAVANVKSRNPNNAKTDTLANQIYQSLALFAVDKDVDVPDITNRQSNGLTALKDLRTRLCNIYTKTGGTADQTFNC